ncbi:hypothetical protein BC332_20645 [Capsicum chinense]|nr:hypothetical protein BC332_20645 [Capsicum chinense]
MQRGPIQRTSPETQSSTNLDESVRLSVEDETGADDIDRAMGSGARDIVNYYGWIMRTTVSFRDGSWQNIVLKHGEAMWYRVKVMFLEVDFSGCVLGCESCRPNSILILFFKTKQYFSVSVCLTNVQDKFEVRNGLPEHNLKGFVISTMQRLFRSWKDRLHVIYSSYNNDKDRLSHLPEDVELDDWKHLVEHFGSDKFKGQLQQLVVEQQSEEIELCMTGVEILTSVLSEKSGYVWGKDMLAAYRWSLAIGFNALTTFSWVTFRGDHLFLLLYLQKLECTD